jgi:hypothetical protein
MAKIATIATMHLQRSISLSITIILAFLEAIKDSVISKLYRGIKKSLRYFLDAPKKDPIL